MQLHAGPLSIGYAAAVTPRGDWLAVRWETDVIPYVGLWIDNYGWPVDQPVRQVSIQPTTAPTDYLPVALAGGNALIVPVGGMRRWSVRIALGFGPPGPPLRPGTE